MCAPSLPAEADAISAEDVRHLLRMLAAEFRYVVLDTAPGLSDTTLAALDETTDLVLLTSMDVPGVRGLRKELDTLAQLGQHFETRQIVLNFVDPRGLLSVADVEATINTRVDLLLPRSKAVRLDQPGRPAAAGRRPRPDDQAARRLVDTDGWRPCRAAGTRQARPHSAGQRPAGRDQPAPHRSPVAPEPEGAGVMTLSERLEATSAPSSARPPGPSTSAAPVTATATVATAGQGRPADRPSGGDALTELKDRAATAMYDRLGARLNDPSLTEAELHALVRAELSQVVEEEKVPLTAEQQQRLVRDVTDDVLGHGPLQQLLDDTDVTEIMVNGPDTVYVEQNGKLLVTDVQLHLRGPPAPDHRADRHAGGSPHRRVLADGRRPPGRRLPGQRDHRAAGLQRLHADHPEVRPRPVQGERPDHVRAP